MAQRNYPRLSIYEFGEHLLTSGDLDPVYIALHKAELDEAQLYRWLLAYWCFYHCGVASYISEAQGDEFWQQMLIAGQNTYGSPTGERWPRGSERRHFRGEACIKALHQMRERFPDPADAVRWIAEHVTQTGEPIPFVNIAARAKGLPLFGPWISFKVGDMLDRLGIVPVNFDQASVFMFTDPVKAALMLWRQHERLPAEAQPKDEATKLRIIDNVVAHLTDHFKDHTAPPIHERPVGLQEIETILCCWKSHMNGHYPLYNDMTEINAGLRDWLPHSETARALYHAMPKEPGHVPA